MGKAVSARILRARRTFIIGGLVFIAAPLIVESQPVVAPGYRAEVVVRNVPHVIDAIEPFPGVVLASVGAEVPGSRLLRFALPEVPAAPVVERQGVALLSSRSRLGPIVSYRFTGRTYVGVSEQGQIIELPQGTLDLSTLVQWEPRPFIIGLTALHDFTFGADSRLRVADGSRVLAAPIYFTSPVDAARLPTIYRCRGVCQGVAVVGDDLLVLEADDQTGRVIRRDSSGAVHLVAGGLPHPGEGVRVGPRGDLFFPSDEGILRIGPHGHVVSVLSRLSARARVNVDPHGNLLVTEPNSGVVVRLHTPELR